MKGIIVFDEAGIPIAEVGFEEFKMNPGLFTSFMSAMQIYSEGLTGGKMKELEYGELRILIGTANEYSVITFHTIGDDDSQWNHEVIVDLLTSKEYQLNDAFLAMLRQLLSDERVLMDEVKSHLFPRE